MDRRNKNIEDVSTDAGSALRKIRISEAKDGAHGWYLRLTGGLAMIRPAVLVGNSNSKISMV